MNAQKFSRFGIGFGMTALSLCGLLAVSCAGGDSNNGAGGQGGGQGGGGGGQGGAGGGGGGDCVDPPADGVNFCSGKAQGVMTGYAFIALGKADTATDPKCAPDSANPDTTRNITAAGSDPGPCPTTGTTKWKAKDSLCISGSIPPVTGGDYAGNWGLQIGVNTVDPPATAAGQGTLGKSYSTIAMTTTGTVTPTNTAIRVGVHLVSQAADANPYCATMSASGKVLNLTSFNTACWDGTGTTLTAADVPNIDKVLIQISSDTTNAYTITDFCLTGIQFGQ